MATKAGTLELIARELGSALAPLEQRLDGGGAVELLAALGVRVPASVSTNSPFSSRRSMRMTKPTSWRAESPSLRMPAASSPRCAIWEPRSTTQPRQHPLHPRRRPRCKPLCRAFIGSSSTSSSSSTSNRNRLPRSKRLRCSGSSTKCSCRAIRRTRCRRRSYDASCASIV